MNLPPVHGYGMPQVMSMWNEKQNRDAQKDQFGEQMDFKDKQLEEQKKVNESKVLQQEAMRTQQALTLVYKQLDISYKMENNGSPTQAYLDVRSNALEKLGKLNKTEYDPKKYMNAKDAQKTLQNESLETLAAASQKAKTDPTATNVAAYDKARVAATINKVDETVMKVYGDIEVGKMSDMEKNQASKDAAKLSFNNQKELREIPQATQPLNVERYLAYINDPATPPETKEVFQGLIDKMKQKPTKNKIELTKGALAGNQEDINILEEMSKSDIELAKSKGAAAAEGKILGLQKAMDLQGTAQAVLDGNEVLSNVKNTFGVPIQETVRKMVLSEEPNFNFLQPDAMFKSLTSSLRMQQKNEGMMKSFVKNINGQVDKLENQAEEIVSRVGVRAWDLPIRELKTTLYGSGDERVYEAYMKEVSAEIAKLSMGSAASIALLPENNRKEWENIHDVNLSMKQILKVLNGTREMANIRIKSVQDAIDETVNQLGDIRKNRGSKLTEDSEMENFWE